MIGNQIIINALIIDSPLNPVKESIGNKDVLTIISTITSQAEKEWRKQLSTSDAPIINYPGFGHFKIMFSQTKRHIRWLIKKIRSLKKNFPDTYWNEDTAIGQIYKIRILDLRTTWKQLDRHKVKVNKKIAIIKERKKCQDLQNI